MQGHWANVPVAYLHEYMMRHTSKTFYSWEYLVGNCTMLAHHRAHAITSTKGPNRLSSEPFVKMSVLVVVSLAYSALRSNTCAAVGGAGVALQAILIRATPLFHARHPLGVLSIYLSAGASNHVQC